MLDLTFDCLWPLYRMMLLIRRAEERLADLVEAGEVRCPCHLYIGQEAIATGVCAALNDSDYVWGGHRSHGHYLAKGADLRAMFAEVYGKRTGCSGGRGGSMHLFSPERGILGTVPLVAATIPLAAGTGLASKLRRDGRISVAFFGDGAVEEGHFHESVNLAAVYRLPLIFVCENNLYASHMALLERRASDNIVKAAEAHGIEGECLDGNDVIAVLEAASRAVTRARIGNGPTLLECRTFRWRGHVGASWDMDVGVKRTDELGEWIPRDPLGRLREQLESIRQCGQELFGQAEVEIAGAIDDAVAFARASDSPTASELETHVFVANEASA